MYVGFLTDKDQRRPAEDNRPEPSEVRKVRTPHGTRVARTITCANCGKTDNISFAPRDPERALCRKCAAEHLNVSDLDAGIRPEQDWTCHECGRVERAHWRGDSAFACSDCRKGILSKQDNRTKNAERVGAGKVLRVRRKKNGD